MQATILVKSNGTLGLFWQFHRSFPPPPVQCWVSALKVSPLKQHCMRGEGGGGRGEGQVWEKSRFYYRTGGDDENKANFQGVPYTFDQDCTSEFKCLKMSRWITHAKKSVTSHQYSCFMRILQCSCVTRDLFELPFVFLVDSMKCVFKPCKSPFQVPKHLIIILQFVLQYHTKASLLLYS